MPMFGDVNANEHDSADIKAKRVKIYGYDGTTNRRILVGPSGEIITGSVISGYKISDVDEAEPAYYGFLDPDGKYYILKATASGTSTTYLYSKGDTGYSTAWINRATQIYNTYDVEF